MIDLEVISTIIKGGKLIVSVARFLDSLDSSEEFRTLNRKLDTLRDVHLKAGYHFLSDAAHSSTESNCIFCIDNAYVEFVKAKSSYADFTDALKEAKSANNTASVEKLQLETDKYLSSLEGLVFCYLAKSENDLAIDCLTQMFDMYARRLPNIPISINQPNKASALGALIGLNMIPAIIMVNTGSPSYYKCRRILEVINTIPSSRSINEIPMKSIYDKYDFFIRYRQSLKVFF